MTQQAVRLPPADDLPPPPSRPGPPERRRGAWLRRSFLVRGPRRVYRRWRRSLQQRVVASALLLSLLLAGLFAVNLVSQITRELVEQKTEAAQKVAVRATDGARRDLGALDKKTTKDNVAIQLDRAATEAVDVGSGYIYSVVLRPAKGTFGGVFQAPKGLNPGDPEEIVPESLRTMITAQNALGYAYSTSVDDSVDKARTRRSPSLVFGAPVATPYGLYEMYLIFPLTNEVETVSLVRRAVFLAAVALALLMTAAVWLITRQVVSPVRLAARVAERFAAGEFAERMTVRGEDEHARLAQTFNRMAGNLQQKIGELEELSRVQRRFVADVSHELRTPLTTVRMAADMLHAAREDFPPEIARSAELLQKELDRFEGLLVDLLEISRYDAGAAVLDPELVDLRVAVQRVVDAVAPLAERHGSEVVVRSFGTLELLVEADPRRLQRILRNLVVNAVEHGEGRPVQISLAGDGDAVAVVVRDLGCGFPQSESARVFARFWRADPSRARQTGGTGLGLSIALEDARLHGGWLQAWGSPGRGAAFRLTLPRQAGGVVLSSPLPLEQSEVMTRA
jgi:two-component system sensor histidine kinase MtrB